MSADLVPVRVGECQCPDTPHADGDFVYLRPKLGLAAGIALQRLIVDANQADRPVDAAELTGVLAEAYLLHGVARWDMPQAVTPETIKELLLDDFSRGAPAAEAADGLYMGPVIAPLLSRAFKSSPTTSTNGSTSAPGNGAHKPRKPSKRSSTTTTRTADIVSISA